VAIYIDTRDGNEYVSRLDLLRIGRDAEYVDITADLA
jgi:hypothetical protein